ncbi:MAG: ammonium transporter [Bacteroidota bacterium]|jgi:Amt family ammonium transporter|nr:ammonium transporter [Bacteroidota bacterium]
MGKKLNFLALSLLTLLALLGGAFTGTGAEWQEVAKANPGDVAWMIVASAFVLLMTPGLAFFYGGMVDRKNVISTMLQSFVALGVISVVWVVVGFSLCFGDSLGGIIGNPLTFLNFRNVGAAPHPEIGAGLPFLLFALFQLKFAIITPALFTGSMAGRIRFRSYILFMVLFTLFIYAPLAHMTWHPDGLLMNLGVLDFAGGTVVHMSAGFAALAGAVHLGPRNIDRLEHANIPFIILGTGLLWFGWFGFNAGSALGANDDAVLALANTHFASAAGMITWMFYERYKGRKMNAVGACIGAIVGLVAITPAAGFVTVQESVAIGFIAALVSNWAIARQSKSGLDDTLDVFPSHGVGGMVGMVLTGVFAADVGLTSGETDTFLWHLVALVGVAIFTFGASLLLFKLVDKAIPLRVTGWQETLGLDESQHGETVD